MLGGARRGERVGLLPGGAVVGLQPILTAFAAVPLLDMYFHLAWPAFVVIGGLTAYAFARLLLPAGTALLAGVLMIAAPNPNSRKTTALTTMLNGRIQYVCRSIPVRTTPFQVLLAGSRMVVPRKPCCARFQAGLANQASSCHGAFVKAVARASPR